MKTSTYILGFFISFFLIGCTSSEKQQNSITYEDVKYVSAMRNVMWKGELQGRIQLDTIANKKGLYGVGPVSYLAGEILINDGKSYVSKVVSDTTMTVEKTFNVAAPFLVYANVTEWNQQELPTTVKSINDIDAFVDEQTKSYKRPFVFKLIGTVETATFHIQNLPKGAKVRSPKEAHQGQVQYKITNEEVEIIGFFSTEHQGVFTHHDSNVHLHLITKDEQKMGHLDAVKIKNMRLYLPRK